VGLRSSVQGFWRARAWADPGRAGQLRAGFRRARARASLGGAGRLHAGFRQARSAGCFRWRWAFAVPRAAVFCHPCQCQCGNSQADERSVRAGKDQLSRRGSTSALDMRAAQHLRVVHGHMHCFPSFRGVQHLRDAGAHAGCRSARLYACTRSLYLSICPAARAGPRGCGHAADRARHLPDAAGGDAAAVRVLLAHAPGPGGRAQPGPAAAGHAQAAPALDRQAGARAPRRQAPTLFDFTLLRSGKADVYCQSTLSECMRSRRH